MTNNLIWFGNNLRVRDNQVLKHAMNGQKLMAVYFFDPRHYEIGAFGFRKTGPFRAQFLLETVEQLKRNLENINISLLTFFCRPEDKIPELVEKYHIDTIFIQAEWTFEEAQTITAVKNKVDKAISFIEIFDQFLYHPDDVPFSDFEHIPAIFTDFRKKCERLAKVRPVSARPASMPPGNRMETNTSIPTLADLGVPSFKKDRRSAFPFSGGEESALARLDHYFWETKKLSSYKKTRNGLIGTDYSSKLSAWLANGSISARTIYWEVQHYEKEVEKNASTYWLVFELLWRDYFKYISLKHGNRIFKLGGIREVAYEWGNDEKTKDSWINGRTSDDFVNAHMLELKHTGWMSNRGRQNVASYWAKHVQQDWRIGASYFESLLIDYDVHNNWGNWMYNSGVGNDPRDRTFNTERQATLYDPDRSFRKLWLQPSLFEE
ncbi:DASH family cryptochrome [Flagellimonas baculiformis]|uniref:DASH family cryptochrome n=1 Tax=Flagellimonas baculiformis TaxID=3067310 RepID=UPI0029700040|nr:DASH family cryptochrome [Muricauda sp. D6]